VPLVPVAVAGAFDAWPRWRRLPRPTVIHVVFGPPMLPEQIVDFSERELLAEVERRIVACHEQARASRRRVLDGRADRRARRLAPERRP
jgi:1-acyl-sn-glycerol-3-phosphate acyltransferase